MITLIVSLGLLAFSVALFFYIRNHKAGVSAFFGTLEAKLLAVIAKEKAVVAADVAALRSYIKSLEARLAAAENRIFDRGASPGAKASIGTASVPPSAPESTG
jgi:hypothetical protein